MQRIEIILLSLVDGGPRASFVTHAYRGAMFMAVIGSVTIALNAPVPTVVQILDAALVSFLAMDYLLRIIAFYLHGGQKPQAKALILFMLRPSQIIDVMAVVPFYVFLVIPTHPDVVLSLSLVRFLKLGRSSPALQTLAAVLWREWRSLWAALFLTLVLLLASSTVLHFVERDAQPDKFGDMPGALWWGVITLATVGYGDIVPVTPLGRLLSGGVALLGL